jgi:hypothetical protein
MAFLPKNIQIDLKKTCLYLNIFPPTVPKIAFIGMHSGSRHAILAQQAEFACHILTGKGQLPSLEEMQDEIEHPVNLAAIDYMNRLAKLAGSLPDLGKIKLINPRLHHILTTGPFLPSQNKLMGPYSNFETASKIIYETERYRQSIPQPANKFPSFELSKRILEKEKAKKDEIAVIPRRAERLKKKAATCNQK